MPCEAIALNSRTKGINRYPERESRNELQICAEALTATYAFPAQREEKLLNPDKIPQKTPQIPRDLWFFIFTHLSLAHSEFAPVWLSCYPEQIPVYLRIFPVFSLSCHKNIIFIPKTPQFCAFFCGFFGFLWFFLKIGRDSCLIFERIFYIFYYIIYYILYLFISYLFFVFNNILK